MLLKPFMEKMRKAYIHHYCLLYAEEAPLGQPDTEGPFCSGPTSERSLTGNHPAEDIEWNAGPPLTSWQ